MGFNAINSMRNTRVGHQDTAAVFCFNAINSMRNTRLWSIGFLLKIEFQRY